MPANRPKYLWLLYAAAFVFPIFGIAYGAVETCRADDEARRRGKAYIVLGIVAAALTCIGGAVYLGLQIKEGLGAVNPLGS